VDYSNLYDVFACAPSILSNNPYTTNSSTIMARPSVQNKRSSQSLFTPIASKEADLKIVLLGESAVGKSSLVTRFASNAFDADKESTIGAAFIVKKYYVTDPETNEVKLINFQIWDTAGQERYQSLAPMYYRNASVAIIVFDLTDISSLTKAEFWIAELEAYNREEHKIQILLVGNKSDLSKNENDNQISETVERLKVPYFKTSAKEGTGVDELFKYIVDSIDDGIFVESRETLDLDQKSKKSSCC